MSRIARSEPTAAVTPPRTARSGLPFGTRGEASAFLPGGLLPGSSVVGVSGVAAGPSFRAASTRGAAAEAARSGWAVATSGGAGFVSLIGRLQSGGPGPRVPPFPRQTLSNFGV